MAIEEFEAAYTKQMQELKKIIKSEKSSPQSIK
jgi:hypothetical protein